MTPDLLDLLRCSYCGGPLAPMKVNQTSDASIEFGILSCSECSQRYPVVKGIPILLGEQDRIHVKAETTNGVLFPGPLSRDVVALLMADQPRCAFEILVNPPTGRLRFAMLDRLSDALGLEQITRYIEWKCAHLAAPWWRRQLLRRIDRLGDNATAMDVLRFYYASWYKQELGNYFMFRFGQPRHLVALSLIHLLAQCRGAILDLACGVGHLSHALSSITTNRKVVGVDRNFFQLFMARTYVAPSVEFVCCDGDGSLPFASGAFSGVYCSDAFHYFLNRFQCALELQRLITADGIIVVTRIGNARVKPNEGYELSPAGYRRLFSAIPNTLVSEEAILQRYLNKLGPDIARDPDMQALNSAKWLSLIATHRSELFRDHGALADWPHASGRLRLNPLYAEEARSEDNVTLRLAFPSDHYAREDEAYRKYAPARVRVATKTLESLAGGRRTGEIEQLIRQCVVLGMPERYL